ncbi:hypothetical protein B005_4214 [Nocardiopsis alba ATCC BAA-2165]|uniref:Uncharacterized protein n=1 Tax=Nocardiopsis alba (strain ATCC BAA-2165 / BE74) TaxID=1205910 RepID=J7LEY1_NOCAA|nr:hypothetical protein B005_4214 [Nocardiopsis alba ATCC BAA-2165]
MAELAALRRSLSGPVVPSDGRADACHPQGARCAPSLVRTGLVYN